MYGPDLNSYHVVVTIIMDTGLTAHVPGIFADLSLILGVWVEIRSKVHSLVWVGLDH